MTFIGQKNNVRYFLLLSFLGFFLAFLVGCWLLQMIDVPHTIPVHLFVSCLIVIGSSNRSGFEGFLCLKLIFHLVASLSTLNQGHSDSSDMILVILVHLRDPYLLTRAKVVRGSQLGWTFICRF